MRHFKGLCLCAALGAFLAAPVAAFELIGVRWAGGVLRYRVNPNFPNTLLAGEVDRQIELIQCAAGVWRDQSRARFQFQFDGTTTKATFNENDGVNIVAFSNADGGDALAATLISGDGPLASSADVLFFRETAGSTNKWNGTGEPPSGEFDIVGVAVHELGHALGLDHSAIAQATMFASVSGRGLPLRTLHQDDRDGVEAIYNTRTNTAPAVTIDGVTPADGPTQGGNAATLEGSNFTYKSDTVVIVGGVQIPAANFTVQSCSRIHIASLPGHSSGSVTVQVSNTIGTGRLDNAYRYGGPAPKLLGVTPAEGPLAGGILLDVVGDNFTPDAIVRLGSSPLVGQSFVSPALIRGTAPAGTVHGFVDVLLEQGSDTVTLPAAFHYNAFALKLDTTQGSPGQNGVVVLARATNPVPLSSASFGVVYDQSLLTVLGTTTAGTSASNAEFVGSNVQNNSGVTTVGIVLDLEGSEVTFPPGVDQPLVKILTSLSPSAAIGVRIELGIEGNVGSPPIELIFTRNGSADNIRPLTAGGAVLVVDGIVFRRGDSNRDDKLDISDPVYLLDFLFRGTSAVTCEDAGDSNDDGKLDISDAVNALGYLFQGTAEPPPPFPMPGIDPTPDGLDCAQ